MIGKTFTDIRGKRWRIFAEIGDYFVCQYVSGSDNNRTPPSFKMLSQQYVFHLINRGI